MNLNGPQPSSQSRNPRINQDQDTIIKRQVLSNAEQAQLSTSWNEENAAIVLASEVESIEPHLTAGGGSPETIHKSTRTACHVLQRVANAHLLKGIPTANLYGTPRGGG